MAVCFGAPHLASSWKSQLAQHGLEFQAVHRRNTTNRPDPNDAAILEAANTIAASDGSICIAIASTDSDFLQYHLQLMKRGISSVALVPYASDEKRCVLSGVPSCRFQVPPSTPEFKEAFEERFQKRYDEEEAQQVFQQVGQALQELGYLSPTQPAFPTARSLAIFFHANNEEDVQLYPWCVAAFLARPLLTAAVRNPGDLFFFEAHRCRAIFCSSLTCATSHVSTLRFTKSQSSWGCQGSDRRSLKAPEILQKPQAFKPSSLQAFKP